MSNPLLLRIVKELRGRDSISCYNISKLLGYPEQNVKYHLDYLVEDGIVKKNKSNYSLITTTFIHKGTIIAHLPEEGLLFIDCEYYDQCDCKKNKNDCKKVKELPRIIRDLLN